MSKTEMKIHKKDSLISHNINKKISITNQNDKSLKIKSKHNGEEMIILSKTDEILIKNIHQMKMIIISKK